VLLITVLVVNQLLSRRQARPRGLAVAAQAAIMAAQVGRSMCSTPKKGRFTLDRWARLPQY
jgi:hypothetical protein